jgi:hypothetical protein
MVTIRRHGTAAGAVGVAVLSRSARGRPSLSRAFGAAGRSGAAGLSPRARGVAGVGPQS